MNSNYRICYVHLYINEVIRAYITPVGHVFAAQHKTIKST